MHAPFEKLVAYLQKTPFTGRTFYGEAFALALFHVRGESPPAGISSRFHQIDREDPEFHAQFFAWALMHTGDKSTWKWKINNSTNWKLLQARMEGRGAVEIIEKMQLPSGLILDEPHVASFHYHAFCLALLAEIWLESKDEKIKAHFMKGLHFLRPFILQNGSSLMVGRGQEQLFGYGALILALSHAVATFGDATFSDELARVFSYVFSFQQEDGSLPLVLKKTFDGPSEKVDLFSPRFFGWYGYNNYFDYLPFFAFLVQKALLLSPQILSRKSPPLSYKDRRFWKAATKRYEAVVAAPMGALPNDLAMPYIVANQRALTPLFGGEEHMSAPYSTKDAPLPFFPAFSKSLRSKSKSAIVGNTLVVASPLGLLLRTFSFKEEIRITSRLLSLFKAKQQIVLFEDAKLVTATILQGEGYMLESSAPLTFERTGASALGCVKIFSTPEKVWTLTLRLL